MKNKDVKEQLRNKVFPNLHKIFETISDGVTICGPDAKYLMVNKSMCEMLQISEDKLIGKNPKQLIKEGLYNKSLVYEVIKTKTEVCDIIKFRSGVEVLSRCRPIFDENGILQFIVATAANVTNLNELKRSIEYERSKSEMYLREIEHLRKILLLDADFISESPNMNSILQTVKKIAPTDCSALITGESGVGKEVIAKIIHTNSPRKHAPFIPVSIPAIPENLLEAELFGYEEGAFTGAARGGKIGFFELAQNGTLFLDEIADIQGNLQVKLLRAVETKEIVRLGGTKSIKLNVRLIAATNKDMKLAVRRGIFREDLYYRLNVLPLMIEPLRKRKEDIWPLCLHFVKNLNNKYNMNKELSIDILEELEKYNWPGNVRELRNFIERIVILSDKNTIFKKDVKSLLEEMYYNDTKSSDSIWHDYKSSERSKILETLKQASGNKSKAAKILGIPRSKLYRKLNSPSADEKLE